MPDHTAIAVVRAHFPGTPDQDRAQLRAHADHLERLRQQLRTEELASTEPALTFDPRPAVPRD